MRIASSARCGMRCTSSRSRKVSLAPAVASRTRLAVTSMVSMISRPRRAQVRVAVVCAARRPRRSASRRWPRAPRAASRARGSRAAARRFAWQRAPRADVIVGLNQRGAVDDAEAAGVQRPRVRTRGWRRRAAVVRPRPDRPPSAPAAPSIANVSSNATNDAPALIARRRPTTRRRAPAAARP